VNHMQWRVSMLSPIVVVIRWTPQMECRSSACSREDIAGCISIFLSHSGYCQHSQEQLLHDQHQITYALQIIDLWSTF
jgi:hypothetical protein